MIAKLNFQLLEKHFILLLMLKTIVLIMTIWSGFFDEYEG